jgi:hypothetical protein
MLGSGVWEKPGKEPVMTNGQQIVRPTSFPQERHCIRIGDFKALMSKVLSSFNQRRSHVVGS